QHLSRWLAPEEVKTGLIPSALPIYEPDRLRTWLGTRGKGIDFAAYDRKLARIEEKCRRLEERLEKERARRSLVEERCTRLRADLDEARRGITARLRHWWKKRPPT
ncbi:MAG: hypothetical protein ACR2OZ_16460, partial [Verrucomicrobiales bacterium]